MLLSIALRLLLSGAGVTARADSITYAVLNHGRSAGDMTVVKRGDSVVVRYVFIDRNRGTRLEMRYHVDVKGAIVSGETRAVLADGRSGDPTQRYEVSGDSLRFTIAAGGRRGGGGVTPAGSARPNAFHVDANTFVGAAATPYDLARLASWLLKQPQKRGRVMAGDTSHTEIVADTSIATKRGRQHVRLAMVYFGRSTTGNGVWLDEQGGLVATEVGWFITVRPGFENTLPVLRALETRYRNAQGEAISRHVLTPVKGSLVIKNADVFDSEHGLVRPQQTIVVKGDRIQAVGPTDSVAVPADATVIDATGKTVIPGLWEMHTHVQLTNQSSGSLVQLAQGITTARDMGTDIDWATSQRDREKQGKLASPRLILSGAMDGPQRWFGPFDLVVSTEAEARAYVARFDSLGYTQIKLYNLVHPDLVPTIADEAHKRGMRLSGHIPRGLSVPAAITLGFDEIQHAAFLFSTFFQDSLYVPTMRAYSAVATAVAPNFNVDGPEMTGLIDFLHQHQTVIDGTFNIWIGGGAASVGAGGSTNQEKADAAYLRLIKRLYDGGVPLVPGTDNPSASTYHRELELYEQAGIPAPQVLQIATIASARVMKEDADYGTIAPGKVADLVIVNGNPAEHVSALGKAEKVVRGGRLYDIPELMKAVTGK